MKLTKVLWAVLVILPFYLTCLAQNLPVTPEGTTFKKTPTGSRNIALNTSSLSNTLSISTDTAKKIVLVKLLKDPSESPSVSYTVIIPIILTALTLTLTYFGYQLNRRASLLQKNQWHSQLFKQFYVEETYKEMRYILDFKPDEDYKKLIASLAPGSTDKLSEKFYDYLNFFEFMASMWKTGQIEYQEIINLFNYYLINICEQKIIRDEIQDKDFGFLKMLLTELENNTKTPHAYNNKLLS